MKTKIIIFISAIFFSLSFNMVAQNASKSSQSIRDILKSKQWKRSSVQNGRTLYTTMTFENEQFTHKIEGGDYPYSPTLPYRLSDNPDTTLLMSKRPILDKGKYLITRGNWGKLIVWEIISINSNSLTLKLLSNNYTFTLRGYPL